MIDGLKPYPAMKDSGVPWLGEVPEHWECVRSKTPTGARPVAPSGTGLTMDRSYYSVARDTGEWTSAITSAR